MIPTAIKRPAHPLGDYAGFGRTKYTNRSESMSNNERTYPKGTPTRCNRCNALSPFPKEEARAVRENSRVWRLQTSALLDCGHMDCHWVFDADLARKTGALS
jgi:hypothetical protein